MKKQGFLVLRIILLCFVCFNSFGQRVTKNLPFKNKNSFQIELLGQGVFYSLNYERILFNGRNIKVAGNAGFEYAFGYSAFPIAVNILFSINNYHIELGVGRTIVSGTASGGFTSTRIGFRDQTPDGRLIFKLAFTPLIGLPNYSDELNVVTPWGSVSIGFSF